MSDPDLLAYLPLQDGTKVILDVRDLDEIHVRISEFSVQIQEGRCKSQEEE